MEIKVNVKWNRELFKDIVVDLNEPPEALKIQLLSLTGVPIERQKVLVKGGMLKNDSWGKSTLKDGMLIMMMGTADAPPVMKEPETQFVEDLPEQVRTARKASNAIRIDDGREP
jgi:ubiquitin carboxyl-terminal hydrolase 14